MTLLELSLWSWPIMAALMLALWGLQVRSRNAGTVDVAWAFGTGLVGIGFALGAAGGLDQRQWLLAVLIALWGGRLGWYLFVRVRAESEDGRYRHLREHLGGKVQPAMFVFFQVQALWALLFALPIWAAAATSSQGLDWTNTLNILI